MARENTTFQEDRRISVAGYDTEIDYAKLADKYEYGIKLKGAIISQLKEYTRIKIWVYNTENISD
jgi:hypothetical protein